MNKSNNLSKNFKFLIEKNGGMSLSEIARLTDIPQPTLHNILTGKTKNTRLQVKEKLSKFFGITINQLTGKDESLNVQLNVSNANQLTIFSWKDHLPIGNLIVDDKLDCEIAIKLETDLYEPMFPKNSLLLCNKNLNFTKDKLHIVISKENSKQICTLINQEGISILIMKNIDGNKSHTSFDPKNYDEIFCIKQIRYNLD